ncbi:MAG: tetratricopeptide repeat protein [Deltaproteobacteria bacterium]|nr:tetratricopeptide repeat protein [Deltaproteobacteria bacterium]MDQ3298601.1 tetratricopeptide repeat protein [Myxococcota bacterium]
MIGDDAALRLWTRRGAGLLVVAVAIAVLAPTLVLRTVEFDDHWLWADASPLRDASLATVRDVFLELDAGARRPLGGEYLPVRDVVVMADMALWGDVEQGPHATQLLLFALTIWGLGTLLVRWGLRRELAWIGTLLWAIHPIHVESVAWLSERKGILAGLFVVGCGHAWVRYRDNRSARWLGIAALCAIAGVWSKAPAMFAPAVFAAWDLVLLPVARRRWIAIGVVGAVTALAAVPVIMVARTARVIDDDARAQPASRPASMLGAQGHYVESMMLARPPAIAYPIQTAGPAPLELGLGALTIIGSLLVIVRDRRRRASATAAERQAAAWRLALLAWAWIWFLPVSHLLVRVHILVADRFVYLWSVAACVAVAWLLEVLPRIPRLAATGALVCVLGISTLRAQESWTSSIALFRRAVESNPDDPAACENLALAFARVGRLDDAIATIDRGLVVHPTHGYLWQRKARVLWDLGRSDEALDAARQATDSGFSSASALYAQFLHAHGRSAEALPWAERAVQRQPAIDDYARTLIHVLIALRRFTDAERQVHRLLARDPASPVAHFLLARVLVETGRAAEAAPHLDIAARSPSLATAVEALRAGRRL